MSFLSRTPSLISPSPGLYQNVLWALWSSADWHQLMLAHSPHINTLRKLAYSCPPLEICKYYVKNISSSRLTVPQRKITIRSQNAVIHNIWCVSIVLICYHIRRTHEGHMLWYNPNSYTISTLKQKREQCQPVINSVLGDMWRSDLQISCTGMNFMYLRCVCDWVDLSLGFCQFTTSTGNPDVQMVIFKWIFLVFVAGKSHFIISSAKQAHSEHLKKVLLMCFPVAPEQSLTLSSTANTPFPGALFEMDKAL